MSVSALFSNITNVEALLEGFGPWVLVGIGIIVFIESGVLFPFLPGDSLLVTAAILHKQLNLEIWQLVAVGIAAAVIGDQVGYFLGHKFGRGLFKPDARVLKTEYLVTTEEFFRKWGPLALVLGRFVPIVRTFIPVSAGTALMPYHKFIGWNVTGGVAWVGSMTLVGVFLGGIPGIANSIEKIMLLVVAVSLAPIVFSALKKYYSKKKTMKDSGDTNVGETKASQASAGK